MLAITELNVRADEHVRLAHDADRYGWIRADARGGWIPAARVVLGALVALVRRHPAARAAGGIPTVGSVPVPGTSPRGAS